MTALIQFGFLLYPARADKGAYDEYTNSPVKKIVVSTTKRSTGASNHPRPIAVSSIGMIFTSSLCAGHSSTKCDREHNTIASFSWIVT